MNMKDFYVCYKKEGDICSLYNIVKGVSQDMSERDMMKLNRDYKIYIPSLAIAERQQNAFERILYEFWGITVVGDLVFNKESYIYTSNMIYIEPRGFIRTHTGITYIFSEQGYLGIKDNEVTEYDFGDYDTYNMVFDEVCQKVKLYDDSDKNEFGKACYSFLSLYNPRTKTYYWTDKKGKLWSGDKLHRNPKVNHGYIKADPLMLGGLPLSVSNMFPIIQPVLLSKLNQYLNEFASQIAKVQAENQPPLFKLNNFSIIKCYLNEMLKRNTGELNKYISNKLCVYDTVFHIKGIQSNPTGKGIYAEVVVTAMPYTALNPHYLQYYPCGTVTVLLNI